MKDYKITIIINKKADDKSYIQADIASADHLKNIMLNELSGKGVKVDEILVEVV